MLGCTGVALIRYSRLECVAAMEAREYQHKVVSGLSTAHNMAWSQLTQQMLGDAKISSPAPVKLTLVVLGALARLDLLPYYAMIYRFWQNHALLSFKFVSEACQLYAP